MEFNHLSFDYDNTLAEKGGKIDKALSNLLLDLIINGKSISIITSRSMSWIKENNLDFLDMLIRDEKVLTSKQISKIINNFYLYTGRGNEKFLPKILNGRLKLVKDVKGSKDMAPEEIHKLVKVITDILPKRTVPNKIGLQKVLAIDKKNILRFRINIQKTLFYTNNRLKYLLEKKLMNSKNKAFHEIKIDVEDGYIGVSFRDKSSAIKDLLKNKIDAIIYYGDSPKGNDKPVYDLSRKELKKRLKFVRVLNPNHTFKILSRLN